MIEEILRNRCMYIGDQIPESVANDPRPKFILLGVPDELIKELLALQEKTREETARHIWGMGKITYKAVDKNGADAKQKIKWLNNWIKAKYLSKNTKEESK